MINAGVPRCVASRHTRATTPHRMRCAGNDTTADKTPPQGQFSARRSQRVQCHRRQNENGAPRFAQRRSPREHHHFAAGRQRECTQTCVQQQFDRSVGGNDRRTQPVRQHRGNDSLEHCPALPDADTESRVDDGSPLCPFRRRRPATRRGTPPNMRTANRKAGGKSIHPRLPAGMAPLVVRAWQGW